MDEVGSSSGSRSRLARVSSSRQEEVREDEVEVRYQEDEEILDADPPYGEEEEGFPGGWIISYFPRVHGFAIDPTYTDALPKATRYILQRGNNAVLPYRVYLGRTTHDDIRWTSFTDYRVVVPFDRIALYSGWLACGANTMVRYLPEWCMRQFGRVQLIPRSLFEAAPDTVIRVELTVIFEDWANLLVLEEYRRMQATQEWHCVDGYVTWFYRVSHPLLTPDALGAPKPAHGEILENQQAEDDHATDVLPICQ
ncbi:uncharacterized protein LOC131657742 [Vicia villosa]|uniref:uncharacterized protein LOC131657742 n=1 Tax=Vicia villosa TaxID=3911 RepID=UPI00273C86F3|nr:uncharacterized protein LOC131657742 [Vicia villosa]